MIEVAVTVNLECAHRDALGRIHGHSYVTEAWFSAGPDLVALSEHVKAVAAQVDHTMLEDSVGAPRMEDIASWFLRQIPAAVRIVVRRPTLGLIVQATNAQENPIAQ